MNERLCVNLFFGSVVQSPNHWTAREFPEG